MAVGNEGAHAPLVGPAQGLAVVVLGAVSQKRGMKSRDVSQISMSSRAESVLSMLLGKF
jgi:hypothetical protein